MQSVQCPLCRHYLGDLKCRAYPAGIPGEFATGERAHDRVEPGQVGTYVHEERQERPTGRKGRS